MIELENEKNEASKSLGSIKAKFDNLMELSRKNEKLRKELSDIVGKGTTDPLRSDNSNSRKARDELQRTLAEADPLAPSLHSAERELERAGAACPVCEEP